MFQSKFFVFEGSTVNWLASGPVEINEIATFIEKKSLNINNALRFAFVTYYIYAY